MSDLSERGSRFIQDLGEAARENPVSAALIGMGVVWLFTGSRPVDRARKVARKTGLDRVPDLAADTFDAASATLKAGVQSMSDSVNTATHKLQGGTAAAFDGATRMGRERAENIAEYARSIPGSGVEMLGTFRSNLTEVFRTQPLALGAVGLAIGAGIAAAFPSTEMEANYFGESSDAVKEKAKQFAAEQTDRATTIAEDVVSAVADEARKQGLTVDDVRSAASEVPEKVGRVLSATGKGISERLGADGSSAQPAGTGSR